MPTYAIADLDARIKARQDIVAGCVGPGLTCCPCLTRLGRSGGPLGCAMVRVGSWHGLLIGWAHCGNGASCIRESRMLPPLQTPVLDP